MGAPLHGLSVVGPHPAAVVPPPISLHIPGMRMFHCVVSVASLDSLVVLPFFFSFFFR